MASVILILTSMTSLFLLGQSPQPVGTQAAPAAADCPGAEVSLIVAKCPRTVREFARTRSWMPSELAIEELNAVDSDLDSLAPERVGECAWAMDWYGTLPDIAALNSLTSILDSDSRRLERFSRRQEAATRIASMFALAGNLAKIPRLDAQRAASRIAWQAAQRLEQFLIASRSSETDALIARAIDAYSREHEESMAKVVQSERVRWVTRPIDRIKLGENGAALYAAAVADGGASVTLSNEYPLSRLAGEPLLVEMRAAEAYFDGVREVWGRADAPTHLANLGRRAERGDFGGWMAAARPDFVRVVGELGRTKAGIKTARSALDPAPKSP